LRRRPLLSDQYAGPDYRKTRSAFPSEVSMSESTAPPTPSPVDAEEQLNALADVFGEYFAEDFQDPVVFRRYCFQSPAAKQFYKRNFPLVSRTLFLESVYRRRPLYNQDILDEFVTKVAKRLSDIQLLISTQSGRLKKLCDSNGQLTDAAFVHPYQVLVPIIAAHASTYVRCLLRLDELYQLSGSATLNGVIDGNQRKAVEQICRKAIRAFSTMLRYEIITLRKESARMRSASKTTDVEVEHAEDAQEQALQVVEDPVQGDDQPGVTSTEARQAEEPSDGVSAPTRASGRGLVSKLVGAESE
jgi:hypothetical protein